MDAGSCCGDADILARLDQIEDHVESFAIHDQNSAVALTTGDGQGTGWSVPAKLDGWTLSAVLASIPGTVSSSGVVTVQVRNQTDSVDMLSTRITIDQGERTSLTAATPPVINAANATVTAGDIIQPGDIDTAGASVKGLIVSLTFTPPAV